MPPPTHHVLLIPGFFGFANFGSLDYFPHVEDLVREQFDRRGGTAKMWRVPTPPTASLRRRATTVAETALTALAEQDAPIHLVGHSTGGLDARLFATPRAVLSTTRDLEPAASRIRSIVTA